MKFTYFFGNIELICEIDQGEIDKYSHSSGHYTEPGDLFVESVSHMGQDITELLAEDVIDDILREFIEEISEV